MKFSRMKGTQLWWSSYEPFVEWAWISYQNGNGAHSKSQLLCPLTHQIFKGDQWLGQVHNLRFQISFSKSECDTHYLQVNSVKNSSDDLAAVH